MLQTLSDTPLPEAVRAVAEEEESARRAWGVVLGEGIARVCAVPDNAPSVSTYMLAHCLHCAVEKGLLPSSSLASA